MAGSRSSKVKPNLVAELVLQPTADRAVLQISTRLSVMQQQHGLLGCRSILALVLLLQQHPGQANGLAVLAFCLQ
jgi:hypothetical protein